MDLKICTVGGYNEVGKNMTAIKAGDEAVILDMGFYLPKLVSFEEEGNHRSSLSRKQLIRLGVIPNDNIIDSWRNSVKAIACSHAHLDHIGAVPYLSNKYNAPILGTPYTTEVLNNMIKDERIEVKNQRKILNVGSTYKVNENIKVEFITTTHSTPQTAMIAVHTKKGVILYTNDFKFDNHPVVGKKPNYDRLKELGKDGVLALVTDSLYSGAIMKTPSEKIARELLKDVMLGTECQDNPMIVTCFASHIARLKSIVDFGKKLNRKIIFMGRSLLKYTNAAKKANLIDFSKEAEIIGYSDKIKKAFKRIKKQDVSKYLLVCTGGQGEPNSVLSRVLNKTYDFHFSSEDTMIFSNRVIPVSPNIENREKIEKKLINYGVRVYKDLHVSGHASREDLRDLIKMVNPQHIIPAHGNTKLKLPMVDLAEDMGFKKGKEIHMTKNGQTLSL